MPRNLDEDQLQVAWLRNGHGEYQQELLISESSVHATLIHFYHPESRCIRQWITQQVVPRLREDERFDDLRPDCLVMHWLGEVEVPHWRGTAWLPLGDGPRLLRRPPLVIG
ncbi:BRO-N domain-containing protein [Metapseudomonas boanensis]|uniref:hypothetical protein n=1 Tax=Metapseudomonas boanensis TaxID=2822138 RepID=UPI002040D3EA|nr:hypothetical protein [Pseudomonas boanensis]